MRRGLTLLEVLASAVLLAAIAAACAPLLGRAMRDSQAEVVPFDLLELSAFADDLMAHAPQEVLEQAHGELPWPDSPDRAPVAVERLTAADAHHAWLMFTAGPWTVCRWVAVSGEDPARKGGQPP